MAEILWSLLSDIDLDLVANLSNRVRVETFGKFMDHAETYLKESRYKEAGAIAGVI